MAKPSLGAWILLFAASFAVAGTVPYRPDFDPAYRPDPGSDEGGFWYQMDKHERALKTSPYLIRDPELNSYISGIVCRLADEFCSHIRVYIIDNPYFNAAMGPNGMMLVHTGLLLRVADEAQLAAVLGHEIAHFLRSHQIKRWRSLRDSAAAAAWADMGLAVLTGVYGMAQMGVMGAALSYSRQQEEEADLYGLQLLAHQGYDPRAAAELWQSIAAERNADQTKEKRSTFFATHPAPENRNSRLTEEARKYDGDTRAQDELISSLSPHYLAFMRGHMQLQEHEQTELLLESHRSYGYPLGQIAFFQGELYRLRKAEGDQDKALVAYNQAIAHPQSPAEAYRELGYLRMKRGENIEAAVHFRRYLDVSPEASDREMIEFYLGSFEIKTDEAD